MTEERKEVQYNEWWVELSAGEWGGGEDKRKAR